MLALGQTKSLLALHRRSHQFPECLSPFYSLQNSFSSVFHMEYEELGEVLDVPKR